MRTTQCIFVLNIKSASQTQRTVKYPNVTVCTSMKMLDNSSLSSTLATLGFSVDGTKNLSTNESNKSTLFGSDWMDSKWISACILHEKSISIRNTNSSTVYALGWERQTNLQKWFWQLDILNCLIKNFPSFFHLPRNLPTEIVTVSQRRTNT